jgi:hypothetical protein
MASPYGSGGGGTHLEAGSGVMCRQRLQAAPRMPLDVPPPRDSRFGSPLTLSRVHWARPELVAEVKFLDRGQPAAPGRL